MEDSKITAGVRVIGIAEAQKSLFSSEPSKPQRSLISYLLTGRSLESSGEVGSTGSVSPLIGLGISKDAKLVGSIGQVLVFKT